MRLHLVDGTYELFRAHFSRRPPHLGPDGTPLKATVGLVSSLLALLSDPADGADEERAATSAVRVLELPLDEFRTAPSR